MNDRDLVCIACPLGCRLRTLRCGDGTVEVSGNKCPKGGTYGREEMVSPRRVVTATARLAARELRRLPVKTSGPFPRERIGELLAAVYALRVEPPVRTGQVLLENFGGTGVDLVATRSVG